MRQLVRTLCALALLLIAAVVPAATASAKTLPAAKWAKKNHLKGAWRSKDADRDGLKNLAEFKLGTNPRKADSDRDGLKDGDEVKAGAEHAGVVTAFDGDTVTIRQFNGGKLTATLSDDADCSPTDDSTWSDDSGDDASDDTSDDSSDDTSGDDS